LMDFVQILRDWRADGTLAGVDVNHSTTGDTK
jgi:hypothetical protein